MHEGDLQVRMCSLRWTHAAVCAWKGLSCGGDGTIMVALAKNNLVGTLPPSWGSLRMTAIYLKGNRLRGPLPDSWGGHACPADSDSVRRARMSPQLSGRGRALFDRHAPSFMGQHDVLGLAPVGQQHTPGCAATIMVVHEQADASAPQPQPLDWHAAGLVRRHDEHRCNRSGKQRVERVAALLVASPEQAHVVIAFDV